MSRFSGSNLMFDEDEIKATKDPGLPRLIRIMFYGLGITNDSYLDRYSRWYKRFFPDKTRKEFSQKAAADRKFLMERRKLTYNMQRGILSAMGYTIEAVSMRLRDDLTGEVMNFSTDDTIEELNKLIDKNQEVGIQGIM